MASGKPGAVQVDGAHRSETELEGAEVDLEIVNDGSLNKMRLAIESIRTGGR